MARKVKSKNEELFIRISVIALMVILVFASGFFIIKSLKKQDVNYFYSYNLTQDLDYKVKLFNNSFIAEEYLTSGKNYISNLVDKIIIDYKYDYSAATKEKLNYKYSVIGELHAYDGSSSGAKADDLFGGTKAYIFVPEKTYELSNTNAFKISEPIEIKYNDYEKEILKLKKEGKVSVYNASLDLAINVEVFGEINGKAVSNKKLSTISIPLDAQSFKISTDFEKDDSDYVLLQDIDDSANLTLLIIGILLLMVAIALFVIFFKTLFDFEEKPPYVLKLNRILKEYGEIIVEVVNPISSKGLNVVEVKGFNELIDLEEELRIPITFYEIKKDREGEFVIVHDKLYYHYVLDNKKES